MTDVTRFALACAGLLLLVAIVDRTLFLNRMTRPSDAIELDLRLRWWVETLLTLEAWFWCLGLRPFDADWLDALIRDHGWKVVERRV